MANKELDRASHRLRSIPKMGTSMWLCIYACNRKRAVYLCSNRHQASCTAYTFEETWIPSKAGILSLPACSERSPLDGDSYALTGACHVTRCSVVDQKPAATLSINVQRFSF